MTVRAKKLLSAFFKLAILALAVYYIYHHIIKNNNNLQKFEKLVNSVPDHKVIITLAATVVLMMLNWLLESLKWLHLTRKLHPFSVLQSVEAVLCGLTWAVFTPNRIGEYGGRVMFLPVKKRVYGLFSMAVGSFGQNVVTNVFGAAALIWFLYNYVHLNHWVMLGVAIMVPAFIILMLVLYFNVRRVVTWLNQIKFIKKYHRFFDIMGEYNFRQLLNIIWFCIARFFVFTCQYCLIIHLLVPQVPLLQVALLMFVFFFVQSAIPSLDFIDIGVRGVIASSLFVYVTDNTIAVVVAVSLIYIMNMVIPAVLGSLFVFKLKFFDRAY